jgi:nitrogen fixation protein NifX
MSYKVAVASSDGKVVNQHFGRCRQFLVFNITDQGAAEFSELRESEPPCGTGDHDEDHMAKTVEQFADCRFLLVSRIGPGAEAALGSKSIKAFAITDFIDKALEKLIKYTNKQQ